ncbi:MAG TPA: DsbA family protein [Solirubrobacterales bacterium]|nr:DsbA family protein [Solirubrobacterales bacterium]
MPTRSARAEHACRGSPSAAARRHRCAGLQASLEARPDRGAVRPPRAPPDPRVLPRGLEPRLLGPDGPLPGGAPRVPEVRGGAVRYLGGRRLLPPGVRGESKPPFPAPLRLRAQGRGRSRLPRLPCRGRNERAGTVRDRRGRPAAAPATLVEYGDFECPYCGAAHPIIKRVQDQMGESLRFVFRHFPISTSHPHAELAAEAAEAAGAQGWFWEMHDLLFENQKRLRDEDLHGYAEQLGLEVETFGRELAEHVHAERVREDFMSGVRSGVNGTPTFYVNGRRHDDVYDVGTLVAALERAAAS